jgi:hypothetical protein
MQDILCLIVLNIEGCCIFSNHVALILNVSLCPVDFSQSEWKQKGVAAPAA